MKHSSMETKTIRKMREVHQCNVPWLILMDPTSACNLHCTDVGQLSMAIV